MIHEKYSKKKLRQEKGAKTRGVEEPATNIFSTGPRSLQNGGSDNQDHQNSMRTESVP